MAKSRTNLVTLNRTIEQGARHAENVVGVTSLDDAFAAVLVSDVDNLSVVQVVQVVAGDDQQLAEPWNDSS